MKKIVIIGSKPDAEIPEGDIAYFTNTSLSLYHEHIKQFNRIIVVIIKPVLNYLQNNRQKENPYRDFNSRTWDILSKVPDKMVIISDKETEKTVKALQDNGYKGKINHLTTYDRRKLIEKVSGCRDPIVTQDFWTLPANIQIKCINSMVKSGFKRIVSKKSDVYCVLRPSTGIFSIVHAIHEIGTEAEYVISGIGLKKRGVYSDGKNEEKSKQNPFSHIFADQKVLKELAQKHNIFTTEHELMHILPKFEGWHKP